MPSIRNLTLNIKTGQKEELPLRGDGLRLVLATVPIFFKSIDGEMDFYLEQGEQAIFDSKVFKRMQVWHNSGADQLITITVSEGSKFNGAKISGSVTITGTPTVSITSLTPTNAAGANANPAVTNVAGQLVAVNAARKYCLIQNKDAAGNIYINFGGVATVANGLKIPAGGSYELNCNVLTAAISAIGDIANNTNVVVITG
jgi:hypothetical protein